MSFADHGQYADIRITPESQTLHATEFTHLDALMSPRLGSANWQKPLDQLIKAIATARIHVWWVAGASVVAFALGWAAGSTFSSIAAAKIATSNDALIALIHKDAEEDARRERDLSKSQRTPLGASEARRKVTTVEPGSASTLKPLVVKVSRNTAPHPTDASRPLPLTVVPQTKPSTIAGWSVRSTDGESVVLVGPNRVWTVRRGDSVPGVGRIDTIVRWGDRWIVATSSGLISTD